MQQILFHGGSHIITNPEIREPERTLDFGKGFYLTTSKEQAERWVKNRLLTPDAEGYVNTYRFDFSSVSVQLNVKIFESADEEWVDFVLANRMIDGFTHDFDIVIGPVADDKVYTQFSLFEQGVISKDTLIRELKTYRLADQYLFHTKRALPHLKFVSHYVVRR
ncbi:DUF3990 domain-containing protein [Muribaculaceae bacterium Isolate-113 (HZI)]|nr:DUF3990 domain-containing protein [Muribaculaceae bacterium Isolate-114 (HZI)]ROT19649.1 DUF3990 domain-containing protein [Muribaculaceae bacterium Isolate-113 (HZI)]